MNKFENIVNPVAERVLDFIKPNGEAESVTVRIGLPFEQEKESWCCPYEISSASKVKRFGMVGIDSIQALDLTLKTLNTEIKH